jgi:hypothetical protein
MYGRITSVRDRATSLSANCQGALYVDIQETPAPTTLASEERKYGHTRKRAAVRLQHCRLTLGPLRSSRSRCQHFTQINRMARWAHASRADQQARWAHKLGLAGSTAKRKKQHNPAAGGEIPKRSGRMRGWDCQEMADGSNDSDQILFFVFGAYGLHRGRTRSAGSRYHAKRNGGPRRSASEIGTDEVRA